MRFHSNPISTLMKTALIALVAFCSPVILFGQDITGLWKGTLINNDNRQTSSYEVFISKVKEKYTGYSQVITQLNGKQYYSIKKLKVRIAKDGKVVIQDDSMVENNYPESESSKVIQLNVLDLSGQAEDAKLNGIFVTNRTRQYDALNGSINLEKVTSSIASTSTLMQFLDKRNGDPGITALK